MGDPLDEMIEIIHATPTPEPGATPTPEPSQGLQGAQQYGTVKEPGKEPPKYSSGLITEAIREGFAMALMGAGVPPAIRDLLLSQAGNLDDKLHNLAGEQFKDITSARQGAYYFMQSYVLPAAQNLGYDVLLGPDMGRWATTAELVGDPKAWYKNLEMALYQTKQELAAIESLSGPAADPSAEFMERPDVIAARAAQAIRATIPSTWKAAPPPGLPEPAPGEDDINLNRRRQYGAPPLAQVNPPQTIEEEISAARDQDESYRRAMQTAGYVPSVVPEVGIEYGGQFWVRPGERGSSEAEEFARQGRGATFRAAVPLIQAGQTAANERQAKYAQGERIAAQVAPYTGTVAPTASAGEAFKVGIRNQAALEAGFGGGAGSGYVGTGGGRAAYESALLGSNVKEKFGQSRLRSEFPTPSAGYETSIAGQWGGGNPVEVSQKMQAAREPWTTRRMAEPLAAQFPKEWEQYAAPRTYGWEKGAAHVPASSFTPEEPFDMPFKDFVKKRRTPLAAPTVSGRSLYRFGGR